MELLPLGLLAATGMSWGQVELVSPAGQTTGIQVPSLRFSHLPLQHLGRVAHLGATKGKLFQHFCISKDTFQIATLESTPDLIAFGLQFSSRSLKCSQGTSVPRAMWPLRLSLLQIPREGSGEEHSQSLEIQFT